MSAVMAAALGTAAWSSYAGAKRAARLVERGEGVALMTVVGASFRGTRRPPTDEELDVLIQEHSDAGLRYVAFIGHDHEIIAQGGEAAAGTTEWLSQITGGPQQTLVTLGKLRGVAVMRPPGGPPPRGRGPRGRRPRRPPPFGGPPMGGPGMGGPPMGGPGMGGPGAGARPPPGHIGFAIEFEPVQAAELAETSALTLWLGLGTTFAFLLTAALTVTLLRQRERLEERAAQERQLAALGEMSAVLAHEIRNPLASLKGHAQLLAETLPTESREHAKAARVVREAIRLEGLSNDLLDFVRAGAVQRKEAAIGPVLREACEVVGSERVLLDLENAPETWPLDALRMRQVIENLLQNALDASPEGARVSLTASVANGRLVIACRDHGDGVPADAGAADKLFEPFHTTRTQGTGLGLAVARRIVELHGGKLTAKNHPEGGAIFTVKVPKS